MFWKTVIEIKEHWIKDWGESSKEKNTVKKATVNSCQHWRKVDRLENGVLILNSGAGIFSYKNMEVDPGCSPREV